MLIVAIALLMLPLLSLRANQRVEVSGVVTNGALTWTNTADYVSGYFRQCMIKYASTMSSTATVEQVKTDASGIARTNLLQNLFFTNLTDGVWLPNKDVDAGVEGDIWRITAPSTNNVPASIWFLIQDQE